MPNRFLVAIFIVAAVLIIAIWLPPRQQGEPATAPSRNTEPKKPVFEKRKPVRDVTPQEFSQAPKIADDVLERLPAVRRPRVKPKARPSQWKLPQVLEAGRLRSGSTSLHLSGIRPLPMEKICIDDAGKNWPCGRFGRTAFRNFVRGRTLSCERGNSSASDTLVTACKIGSTDLALWLVTTGWVEPMKGHFEEEAKRAKEERRGIWRRVAP